jgi:hypothetical protein
LVAVRLLAEEGLVMIEIAPGETAPTSSAPVLAPGSRDVVTGFRERRELRRERRRERRRLAEADRRSAALAELHRVAAVLRAAAELIERGWVQNGWFAYRDDAGVRKIVAPQTLHLLEGHDVVGACLVGAVVEAGGGVESARTQLVQRSLDLVWHTLRREAGEPVRWCPGPTMRALQVRDLARWNDTRGRTSPEVAGLLRAAAASADDRRTAMALP